MRFIVFFFLMINIALGTFIDDIRTIKYLEVEIIGVNRFLDNTNNVWMKRYSNYQAYQQVLTNLASTEEEIESLENKPKTLESQNQLNTLKRNQAALEQQKKSWIFTKIYLLKN